MLFPRLFRMALVPRLFPLLLISSGLACNLVSSHRPISTLSLVVPYQRGDSGVPLAHSNLQHRFTVTRLRSLTLQHAVSSCFVTEACPFSDLFMPHMRGPIFLLKIDVTSSCNELVRDCLMPVYGRMYETVTSAVHVGGSF